MNERNSEAGDSLEQPPLTWPLKWSQIGQREHGTRALALLAAIADALRQLGRPDLADQVATGNLEAARGYFFNTLDGVVLTEQTPLQELLQRLQAKKKPARPPKSPGPPANPAYQQLGEFAYVRIKKGGPPPPNGETRWTDRLIAFAFAEAFPRSDLISRDKEGKPHIKQFTKVVKNARQKYKPPPAADSASAGGGTAPAPNGS